MVEKELNPDDILIIADTIKQIIIWTCMIPKEVLEKTLKDIDNKESMNSGAGFAFNPIHWESDKIRLKGMRKRNKALLMLKEAEAIIEEATQERVKEEQGYLNARNILGI